uniref:Phosphomannomutase n=1 Tax=Cyprinus carpio TaxID=7962 RepID=A0A8C1TVN0_CYPCA
MSTSIAGQEEMDRKSRVAGGRNVLCLFDVDGTLTPPREVKSCEPIVYIGTSFFFFYPQDSYEMTLNVIVKRMHGL